MKKKLALFIILLVFIYSVSVIKDYNDNTSKYGQQVEVTIKEGSSDANIAKLLQQKKLVKRDWLFLIKLKNSKYKDKLKYGTFKLYKGMCMSDIIKVIANGGKLSDEITLLIPEGYSVELIAKKVEQVGLCTEKEFLSALNDNYNYEFIKKIPNVDYKYKLQGFLFPDTYNFKVGTSAHNIIDTMLADFQTRYSKINKENTNLNMYQVITLASIIEKESKLDREREMISGVIYNRLNRNMLLQIDATVSYIKTNGLYNAQTVYYNDLKSKSAYNTYRYKGLPVGPISNPGVESIVAALNPKKHNYLYYHTDEVKKDGSHIFSTTYLQHSSTQK